MGVLPDWMIKEQVKIEPFCPQQARPGVISYGVSSYGYDVRVGYKFKVFSNVHGAVVDPKGLDPRAFVDFDLTPLLHEMSLEQDQQGYRRCTRCGKTSRYTNWTEESFPRQQCYGKEQDLPHKENHILIPPNSFALAETVEYLEIPRDMIAICVGKSTYARCGIVVNVTPLEPEWKGKITIEISNTTPLPAKVYAGEGIAQILFLRSDSPLGALGHKRGCDVSYADKKGKYQDQPGLVLPKVD